MDGVEGLSRKRRRSEDFTKSLKTSNRRKTLSCTDGIKNKSAPQNKRANKSLPPLTPKKLEKFLQKTPKLSSVNVAKTPRKRSSLEGSSVKTRTPNVGQLAAESSRKRLKLSCEEINKNLPNAQVKSRIPTINLNKMRKQVRLSLKNPFSKVNGKPLLKKSVLDRVVKPFSPSRRNIPSQNHNLVTKIPTSFNFTSKTKPRSASPKIDVNKASTSKNNILSQEQGSSKLNGLSKSFTSSKNKSLPIRNTSPKNTSLKESISKSNQLTNKKTSPKNASVNTSSGGKVLAPKKQSTTKTPAKNITDSVKKSKRLSFPINKKKKSKNISMEVKSSSTKKTPLSLNKSMPAKISSKEYLQANPQAIMTKLSENNGRSAISNSSLKTPINQGKMKVEQISIVKSSKRKMVFNSEAGGSKGNELNMEIKKMSYSSAVKRKPTNKVVPVQTSKEAVSKPVVIPKNIMIQANKKTAFSNRHVNSPDPIIISRQSLKTLANKSVGKDLRVPMKSKIAKMNLKNTRETPKAHCCGTSNSKLNISSKRDHERTLDTKSKGSATKSKAEASSASRISSNDKKSSLSYDLKTPSVVRIHNVSLKNDSVLKSSMKQERGLMSSKKVNFDMSHLNSKTIQGEIDSSTSSDICNKKDIPDNTGEPSKCFLAALELSGDSFLDGTTIINSPLKRTRRSSAKAQLIHASTPIQSAQQADWLINTPSRMLMLHPGHSKSSAPGSSKKLEYSASNDISNSSKSNDASQNLASCEVYLTPYITAETLNISVENFVSPLTPGALGLNFKNDSRFSSSRTRKSVSQQVSDSLEVFNSTLKYSLQSPSTSKTTVPSRKAHPSKSPKNDLQDVKGVKEIFANKSPKNDLRNNISGVKRLLSKQKSPKNDLRDVRGVKRVMSSPQKSPNNDLRDVRGVKRVMSSPQKSPKNDLRDVRGVKRVMSSPQKSPKNDLRDVRGVKRVMSSPQKSPKNDLRDVRGVKRVMSSPQKSPKNDLRDVKGVKRLMSSPQKSPKNDLQDVRGVKRLLLSQKSPKNSLSNVSGLKHLMATPTNTSSKIEKSSPEQKQSLGAAESAAQSSPQNVQIKAESKVQSTKRKAQTPKEVPAKRKVKQETDSSAIGIENEKVLPRRTRRNGKQLESESSDLAEEINSNSSRKKVTARKTKSELKEVTDAALITKLRASKRTRKSETNEIESTVNPTGRKTARARKSLVSNSRKRKSSGVLIVSAKKVQFNPSESKAVGGKRSTGSKKSETSVKKTSLVEKEPPLKRTRTTKAAASKSEVKSVGGKRGGKKSEISEKETSLVEEEQPSKSKRTTKATASKSRGAESTSAIAGPSTVVAKDTSSPLKAKRATRTNKADKPSSEAKPTRGKRNTNSEKSIKEPTVVGKESPLKEKLTKGATKAAAADTKTTRGRKVAGTVTAKKETPAAQPAAKRLRKAATNKENEPVTKNATSPPSVPRRVLRKR